MVTFDIECQVTFGGAVPAQQQVAFKKSVGGHSGWYGPTPIVNWTGSSEALILLVACINFMNLSTARSANRAKEVGIRKVAGSTKGHLILQFLTESILLR